MTGEQGSLKIEPMTREDVPQAHALEEMCFTDPWDIDSYYGEVTNPSAYYLVARLDNRIVGFGGMWAVAGEAHIVTLAVHPEFRRHGIGRCLLDALLQLAREHDVVLVTLEVRVGNAPAKQLYASFGFHTVAYRRNYYPDNGEDAAVMALPLLPGTQTV